MSARPLSSLLTLTLALTGAPAASAESAHREATSALAAPPAAADPTARYLFYLHGAIIEQAGRKPRHPRFGVYQYDAVLTALATSGAVIISEQRGPTSVAAYAATIATQIRGLIAQGVPGSNITVVGFSKGGSIAQHVSSLLPEPELRYVLLGACPGDVQQAPVMHGRVLAVRERTDAVPSCSALFAHSRLQDSRELVIAVGGQHGAFYHPHAAWLGPVLAFVR